MNMNAVDEMQGIAKRNVIFEQNMRTNIFYEERK